MTFSAIYQANAWNGQESRSGPGSGAIATERVAAELLALVGELGIGSVLDAACGDSFWMPDLPGYIGIDIAPEAVHLAMARHPDRWYAVGDIRDYPVRAFDLVIFRDAMQHLPLADGVAALDAFRHSGSRYLLASTFTDGHNRNIAEGDGYRPSLSAEPFALGQPVRTIFDGWGYHEPGKVRDPGKVLGLWSLR